MYKKRAESEEQTWKKRASAQVWCPSSTVPIVGTSFSQITLYTTFGNFNFNMMILTQEDCVERLFIFVTKKARKGTD